MCSLVNELNEKKTLLENYYERKINGCMIRAKAIHIESNEKNSAYFANLEKYHAEKKTIKTLKINDSYLTDQNCILTEIHNFYSNIYQKKK